jgi:hypothetical protein
MIVLERYCKAFRQFDKRTGVCGMGKGTTRLMTEGIEQFPLGFRQKSTHVMVWCP